MVFISLNVQVIAISAVSAVSILLLSAFIFLFYTASKKKNSDVKLKKFIKEVENLKDQKLENSKKIQILTFDEKLFDAKMEKEISSRRIGDGLILVDQILDFKKLKFYNPFELVKTELSIENEKISFLNDGIKINIKFSDIFYIKGLYEPSKNALFCKFITYKPSDYFKFQLLSFEDINYLNNIISNSKSK